MLDRINQYFFSVDSKPDRNISLDGLRGIAVLLVVFSHLSNSPAEIHVHPYLNFTALGKTGVYLFFVLSSYLLDRQILLAIQRSKDDVRFWKNYFLRRFFRIYPLYIFLLCVYFLIYRSGSEYCICMRNLNDIISHVFLAKGFGPFWSIPVEFKYYLVSPFIMYFITDILRSKKTLVLPFFFSLMGSISWYTYTHGYFNEGIIQEMWPYLPVFLSGSLLAFLEVNSNHLKRSLSFDLFGIILMLLGILLGGSYFFSELIGWKYSQVFSFFRKFILLQGLLFLLVVYSANRSKLFFKGILEFKGLRFIGLISFSVYTIHWPLVKLFEELKANGEYSSSLLWLSFIIIVLSLSTLTHILIERPYSKISLLKGKKLIVSAKE